MICMRGFGYKMLQYAYNYKNIKNQYSSKPITKQSCFSSSPLQLAFAPEKHTIYTQLFKSLESVRLFHVFERSLSCSTRFPAWEEDLVDLTVSTYIYVVINVQLWVHILQFYVYILKFWLFSQNCKKRSMNCDIHSVLQEKCNNYEKQSSIFFFVAEMGFHSSLRHLIHLFLHVSSGAYVRRFQMMMRVPVGPAALMARSSANNSFSELKSECVRIALRLALSSTLVRSKVKNSVYVKYIEIQPHECN